jgi:hypothetical protein
MDQQNRYLLDFFLGLINRTGAYHMCRDLSNELPGYFCTIRYRRLIRRTFSDGLPHRIAGRLMLREIRLLRGGAVFHWPEGHNAPGRHRVFLDPFHVLRALLDQNDIVLSHDIGPVTHPDLFGKCGAALPGIRNINGWDEVLRRKGQFETMNDRAASDPGQMAAVLPAIP